MTIMSGAGMSRFFHTVRRALLVAAPVAFAAMAIVPANAQAPAPAELRALNDQVSQVQRELDVLQRHVYQGRDMELAQAPGGFADFQVRIEELEGRLRDMNGRIEELNYRINVLNDRLDKFSSDMEFRLSGTQPGGAAANAPLPNSSGTANPPAAPQLTPPPGAGDPNRPPSKSGVLGTLPVNPGQPGSAPQPLTPSAPNSAAALPPDQPLPEGTPQEQYNYAFALLTKSDYVNAERALKAFISAHPTHALAGNAQYWLGESYYVREDYNNAVLAFGTGLQKYPKSDKSPDNMLKLGLSLAAIKKVKEACGAYDMLKRDYPKASQEIMRRADAEKKRLRCT